MNSRQDIMDERIASLEDRINAVQVSLDVLPDLLSRYDSSNTLVLNPFLLRGPLKSFYVLPADTLIPVKEV